MSTKGEKKKIKSLNAPHAVHIHRKENTWTIRTIAGAHKKENSISIGLALRNFTGLARTLSEAKQILKEGEVKINGKIRKNYRFGIGLFDIISIEKQKQYYRVLVDSKERVILKEIKQDSAEKLCKVEKKINTKKDKMDILVNGRTILKTEANVGDSLVINLPKGNVKEVLPLKKDSLIYITKGVHCTEQGKIKEIMPGTAKRKKLIKINSSNGKEYSTAAKNVFVIGKDKIILNELK